MPWSLQFTPFPGYETVGSISATWSAPGSTEALFVHNGSANLDAQESVDAFMADAVRERDAALASQPAAGDLLRKIEKAVN